MTNKYNAKMENEFVFPMSKYFWKVDIEANNIKVLNLICDAMSVFQRNKVSHHGVIAKEDVENLIDEKINDCLQAIEDIKNDEKDSYIVKHDVAIELLREIKEELFDE